MSRTFHHGRRNVQRLYPNYNYTGRYSWCEEDERPKLKREQEYYHWMNTPSWWIREFMTSPQRVEVRGKLVKVMRLKDLEEAPLFPLPKKPHHYFW